MQKRIVSKSIADRLRRFPSPLELVDSTGIAVRVIERVDPKELPVDQELSDAEIMQTLEEIFVRS